MEVKICQDEVLGKNIKSDCIDCDRSTNHKILSSWRRLVDYGPDDFSSLEEFQIIQCQGCDNLSFRSVYSQSDDIWEDESGVHEACETIKLYPNRAIGKLKIQQDDMYMIPVDVRQALHETYARVAIFSTSKTYHDGAGKICSGS